MNPEQLFHRWFVVPIEKLKKLDDGDGAFVALMAALPLYERAIVGKIKLLGKPANDDAIKAEVEKDLGIEANSRAKFWAIYRNGFMHQAMGCDGKTKWRISDAYDRSPKLLTEKGVDFVCIDPWKFADHVLKMFKDDSRLMTASESFPFATIFAVKAE